ncbi:unnamed protein product [Heligmosomoides polygyrus]|uniref:Reverse transcriptase domain-containing protein n=1 Tax=Heligmosomoides polygyrus TaxID=6339 RepID=A0A183F300_HELPZ|nr:unnamed protein product [Heligmosomoides polygyrus]
MTCTKIRKRRYTRGDKENGHHSGGHQGVALSPFFSLLTLDSIVNHLEEGPLRTILFANDFALVADNHEELEEKVQLRQRILADNGLRLNVKKMKFISSEQCAGSILDCQGEAIGNVEEFHYLGSDLSEGRKVDQATLAKRYDGSSTSSATTAVSQFGFAAPHQWYSIAVVE